MVTLIKTVSLLLNEEWDKIFAKKMKGTLALDRLGFQWDITATSLQDPEGPLKI